MQSVDIHAPEPPRPFAVLAAASAALLALALLWAGGETRVIDGDPVWLKPAKFAASFLVTFATMALVQERLSRPWAEGWTIRAVAAIMAAAFAGEMAFIYVQAAQGQASHFNYSTPFTTLMYGLMGVAAVLLVLGIGTLGAVTLMDRAAAMTPALRRATGLGLVASMLLTLVVAGWMSASDGHFVGVPPEGARAVPVLGWSLAVGDYRPAHFLALHAMQALPLYALWRERGGCAASPAEMTLAALAWSALVLATFAQALAGLPIIGI